ncbi:MAG: AmmeMemoRadiSam system protein B [Spirochaetales bacterium]|nr:AmmeMemoRadiSam system protein B [Spirochaetales bacterium]
MRTRKRGLPAGWYPDAAAEVARLVRGWEEEARRQEAAGGGAVAAVAPHAGWYFSGAIAWLAVRSLDEGAETVLVVGGHGAPGSPVRLAPEDAFETPAGILSADAELTRLLADGLDAEGFALAPDDRADNTVEIQLPLVRERCPKARVVWLRVPNESRSVRIGELAAGLARRLGRKAGLLASTDLTHYGPNYGFEPAGQGRAALNWVERENDRPVLEAMARMDEAEVLRLGEERGAACSAGAAAAAIGFARASGAVSGSILAYSTSAALSPSDSFVGYGAVAYRP